MSETLICGRCRREYTEPPPLGEVLIHDDQIVCRDCMTPDEMQSVWDDVVSDLGVSPTALAAGMAHSLARRPTDSEATAVLRTLRSILHVRGRHELTHALLAMARVAGGNAALGLVLEHAVVQLDDTPA